MTFSVLSSFLCLRFDFLLCFPRTVSHNPKTSPLSGHDHLRAHGAAWCAKIVYPRVRHLRLSIRCLRLPGWGSNQKNIPLTSLSSRPERQSCVLCSQSVCFSYPFISEGCRELFLISAFWQTSVGDVLYTRRADVTFY